MRGGDSDDYGGKAGNVEEGKEELLGCCSSLLKKYGCWLYECDQMGEIHCIVNVTFLMYYNYTST